MTWLANLPPGLLMILGAVLLPLVPRVARHWVALLLPVLSFGQLLLCQQAGTNVQWSLLGMTLVPVRIDAFSLVFGYIFHFAAFVATLYSLHVREPLQQVAALAYAGSAIAAVFAGDLFSLFVYWELTAMTSVFLVWAVPAAENRAIGMRYLLIQITSGVLLLAGIAIHFQQSGSLAFGAPGQIGIFSLDSGLGAWLMLIGIGIKAAFPLLNFWLPESYPAASASGTVFLSVFTTKLAVYTLARGFAGTELLVPVGLVMTLLPLLYAVWEDDLRRLLAYALINQLGFMVAAVGLGTELAINGTAGHAVSHVLYKSLLFMSVGAVLDRVGTVRRSQVSGLASAMPWTAACCAIGAAGMALPLFCGFTTKSLILGAFAEEHRLWPWLILVGSSAAVFVLAGPRLLLSLFGGPVSHREVPAERTNMRWAMTIGAIGCVAIGVAPGWLYRALPFEVHEQPYTYAHVLNQLQLLFLATSAYLLICRCGWFPSDATGAARDVDSWLLRPLARGALGAWNEVLAACDSVRTSVANAIQYRSNRLAMRLSEDWVAGPSRATGDMAIWAAVLLAACLLLFYRPT